jgi:hypothetical protein
VKGVTKSVASSAFARSPPSVPQPAFDVQGSHVAVGVRAVAVQKLFRANNRYRISGRPNSSIYKRLNLRYGQPVVVVCEIVAPWRGSAAWAAETGERIRISVRDGNSFQIFINAYYRFYTRMKYYPMILYQANS